MGIKEKIKEIENEYLKDFIRLKAENKTRLEILLSIATLRLYVEKEDNEVKLIECAERRGLFVEDLIYDIVDMCDILKTDNTNLSVDKRIEILDNFLEK